MRRWIVALVLFGLIGGGGLYWWHTRQSDDTEQTATSGRRGRRGGPDLNTPVPVLAARSATQDVPIYLDALGTVQAFNLVSIHAMVDGPLVEVRFKEGQDVKAGDVLARIDPRPYQASLDSAVAKKQQDEANLANARVDSARYSKLVASNYSSGQQADTQRALVAQLDAQVRGDQAAIDTAKTQLSYATIMAPIDGRVGIRQVDNGNIVHSADATPLTVITQLQPISVVFTLPQQVLPQVAQAMSGGMPDVVATRAGDDVPPGGGPAADNVIDRGKLAVLDNQVDPATGTIKLKATFPNAGLKLWPGGFVNVRLLVRIEHDVVTVPTSAVQRGPEGPFVFVIKSDNKAEKRFVKLGQEDDQLAIVQSGLQSGEQIVTDGAQRVTEDGMVAIAGPDGTAPDAVPARERGAPGTAQGTQRGRRNRSNS